MFCFYYLKDFKNKPLDQATLTQIKNDMAIFRKAGFKTIRRFGYSNAAKEPDAPLAIILRHLDQLRPVLHENKDVIAVMHADALYVPVGGETCPAESIGPADCAKGPCTTAPSMPSGWLTVIAGRKRPATTICMSKSRWMLLRNALQVARK